MGNFNNGKILSFNWFLTNNGVPIGTAAGGNNFGWGTFNLARVDNGSLPGPLFKNIGGTSFNTGFKQGSSQFYDGVYNIPDPAAFAAEFAGGGTAPFINSQDSKLICGGDGCQPNLEAVPEPLTMLGTGVVLGALPVLKKEYAKRKKKKDGDA